MNTTRTAPAHPVSIVCLVVGFALLLTACSGSSGGTYQDAAGWSYLRIESDTAVLIDPSCEDIAQAIEDMEAGEPDPGAGYDMMVGTLNDARDTVVWQDGSDDAIEIADDMVRLDDEVYVAYGTEDAKAARDGNLVDNACA
jgi:hypothetical protein